MQAGPVEQDRDIAVGSAEEAQQWACIHFICVLSSLESSESSLDGVDSTIHSKTDSYIVAIP